MHVASNLVYLNNLNEFRLSVVLAVSGPVLRLKPSRRMIFLEKVPGVTVGAICNEVIRSVF